MKRDWRQRKHCAKIFYYVEHGDSGERLEELISVSTLYSTVFVHGFVEFVKTCQTAAILVSCAERMLVKILNYFYFSDLAAQGLYNQNRAPIFFHGGLHALLIKYV